MTEEGNNAGMLAQNLTKMKLPDKLCPHFDSRSCS